MVTERVLTEAETKAVYDLICQLKIKPYNQEIHHKCGELYFELDGKKYRLIYDQNFDWFCDIAYEVTG